MSNETTTNQVDDLDEFEREFMEMTSEANTTDEWIDEEVEEQEPSSETESQDSTIEEETDATQEQEPSESNDLQAQLEQMQKERDHYQHAFNANNGRVSAFQKKINGLEAQLKEVEQAKTQIDNPDNSGMSDEQWSSFVNEFPEMAAAMDSKLKQVQQDFNTRLETEVNSRLSAIQQEFEPLKAKAHEDNLKQQYTMLEQKHPDYREVVSSAEFNEWIGNQPQDMQARMQSTDASQASYLLDVYKAMAGSAQKAEVGAVNQQRQQRLESSVGVKAKPSSVKKIRSDDYDGWFNQFASQS